MKVSVTFAPTQLQRMQVANFLGRRGDLATHAEVRAFIADAAQRRFRELPTITPMQPTTLAVVEEKGR